MHKLTNYERHFRAKMKNPKFVFYWGLSPKVVAWKDTIGAGSKANFKN